MCVDFLTGTHLLRGSKVIVTVLLLSGKSLNCGGASVPPKQGSEEVGLSCQVIVLRTKFKVIPGIQGSGMVLQSALASSELFFC